ncbi:MAG: ATP-binding cassette domain-containing protein [Chloroflexi bacterium]|nr:ATP-binding cassette domain-containing protein [Chloroflexota bacterium]
MIEVEKLTKYYGPKAALIDASFTVKKGEIVGLIGLNGAGKTTAMRILTGYMPPTSGKARVASYDVVEKSLEVRKRMGYMPESTPLYTDMSVRDYLTFMGRIKGIDRRSIRHRVDDVMKKTATTSYSNNLIGTLSKGYRQRVGLAQALIHDPDVLILDEPTVGLDPQQVHEVRKLIKDLAGKHTVILSSHILSEISMICSHVIIIHEGRIIAAGAPGSLSRGNTVRMVVRGPERDVRMKLGAVDKVVKVGCKSVESGLGTFDVDCAPGADVRERLAHAVASNGWGLLELSSGGISLEEEFLALVKKEVRI